MSRMMGCIARLSSTTPLTSFPRVRHESISISMLFAPIPSNVVRRSTPRYVVCSKRVSSRTGRFDKTKKSTTTTATTPQEELEEEITVEVDADAEGEIFSMDDGFVAPDLSGEKTDFWEGEKWDGLGFFVQYMWAFGIVFALIACGIAVATYNEGATDFKDTPVYKESIQSRSLLEEPDASGTDVFETNPTEVAPSLT